MRCIEINGMPYSTLARVALSSVVELFVQASNNDGAVF